MTVDNIITKSIMDKVRQRLQAASAEGITAEAREGRGIMAEGTKTVEQTRSALEAVQQLTAKTMESRTEFDPAEAAYESAIEHRELDRAAGNVDAKDSQGAARQRVKEASKAMRELMVIEDATDYSDTNTSTAGGVQSTSGKGFEFEATSKRLVEDLKRDFDLTTMQASALVGNLATETDNFNTLQEYKPVVEGSRGGYGFAQWTGPRRDRYEAWTKEQGLDPSTYEANYGYLKYELSNTDPEIGNMGKNTIKRLKKAKNLDEATRLVMDGYLKPGTPHLAKRQKSAASILGFFD